MFTSVTAALVFDFFFLPPVGTFNIDDPEDWVALFAFMTVSLVASHLSSLARARELELSRLFDLTRDALLETDANGFRALAERIAHRFRLAYVAICLPAATAFERYEAGSPPANVVLSPDDFHRATAANLTPNHAVVVTTPDNTHPVWLVPLRHRAEAMGVLAVAGRRIEPATLECSCECGRDYNRTRSLAEPA